MRASSNDPLPSSVVVVSIFGLFCQRRHFSTRVGGYRAAANVENRALRLSYKLGSLANLKIRNSARWAGRAIRWDIDDGGIVRPSDQTR